MASENESDEDAEAEAAAAKKKKMMIIGAVVLAGVAYKFVLAPAPAEEPVEVAAAEVEIEEGEVVAIPELVLNLADEGELRYVRLGVAVVLETGTTKDIFEPQMPIVSDVVVDVVSAKTLAELRVPGAKEAIKEELSIKAREAFDDEMVARIIFTSFVMQ